MAVKRTPEETLAHFVAETPAAARLIANARPVTAARFDADYSYLHSRHAGDRFVLVGDAGAFLDPIFSTGVLLAMQSGLEAAEIMQRWLARRRPAGPSLCGLRARIVRRYQHFRRFAVGFYNPAFRDLFFSPSSRFGLYEAVLSVSERQLAAILEDTPPPAGVLRSGRSSAIHPSGEPTLARGPAAASAAEGPVRARGSTRHGDGTSTMPDQAALRSNLKRLIVESLHLSGLPPRASPTMHRCSGKASASTRWTPSNWWSRSRRSTGSASRVTRSTRACSRRWLTSRTIVARALAKPPRGALVDGQ